MAGVTGPCPSCGVVVQAPYATPAPSSQAGVPFASPTAATQPVQETAPLPPGPKGSHVWEPKNVRPRVAESPEIVARAVAEYSPGDRHSSKLPPQPSGRRPNTFFRLAMCLLVVGIMAGVFLGMKKYLVGDPNETAEIAKKPFPKPLPNDPSPILPSREKAEPTTPGKTPQPTPASEPAIPTAATAGDNFPKLTQPASAEIASEALGKFLAAKTLEERLPLIETKLKPSELAATVLAKPLPADPITERYMQETDNAGKFSDWYYNLDFAMPGGTQSLQMLMIRVDAKGQARILADPFLDCFGGRLAAYAAKPSAQPGTFQVVASALARCYDNVPDAEHKLTLKLLPRENAPEIAKAYFTQLSKINEMLKDSTSGFRYGEARPCRVTLRWNTEENPSMPYLEAVSLNELRWNP